MITLLLLHRFLLSMVNSYLDILIQLKDLFLLFLLFLNPAFSAEINNRFPIFTVYFKSEVLCSHIRMFQAVKQSIAIAIASAIVLMILIMSLLSTNTHILKLSFIISIGMAEI